MSINKPSEISVRVPCGCEAVGEGSRLLMPRPLSALFKKKPWGTQGSFRSTQACGVRARRRITDQ